VTDPSVAADRPTMAPRVDPPGTWDPVVLLACAAAGFAAVALPMWATYAWDLDDSAVVLVWDTRLLTLPLVALVGAFLLSGRRRAVVTATLAAWALLLLVSKLAGMTIEILAWAAVQVLLTVGGSTLGQRLAAARRRAAPRP